MKSPTVTFRISPLMLAGVREAIKIHNRNPILEPHDMTSFISQALSEKLAHLARGRAKRRNKRRSTKEAQGSGD
jgi:hypothetical protein